MGVVWCLLFFAMSEIELSSIGPQPSTLGAVDGEMQGTSSPFSGMSGVKTSKMVADACEVVIMQMKMLERFLAPHVRTYVALLRPWGRFFILQFKEPGDQIHARVEHNLAYYQANYLVILLCTLAAAIVSCPSRIFALLGVAGAFSFYAHRGGMSDAWKPKIAGTELTSQRRLFVLWFLSLLWLFMIDGEGLLVIVGLLAVLILGHAAFHPLVMPQTVIETWSFV